MKTNDKTIMIHAKTEAEAIRICNIFHSELKLKWSNGDSFREYTEWHRYKEKTVYAPYLGKFYNTDWTNKHGFKTIDSTFIKETPTLWDRIKSKFMKTKAILFLSAIILLASCSKEPQYCECYEYTYVAVVYAPFETYEVPSKNGLEFTLQSKEFVGYDCGKNGNFEEIYTLSNVVRHGEYVKQYYFIEKRTKCN